MRISSLAAVACAWLICSLLAPEARAEESPASASATAVEVQDVQAWLERIHAAASKNNYQGTFVVSASGMLSSSRIAHYCSGSNHFERLESLDGQVRQVYRHNDTVQTLWPRSKVASIEQRNMLVTFPALLQAGNSSYADHYVLRVLGSDRVAGHDAQVLQLQPRDSLRFGYRLWAEKASSLLMRAEVLGKNDEVLESVAFSELAIGVKPQLENVLKPMRRLEGLRVVRPVSTPTRLEAEGWSLPVSIPGFREVSCVRRAIGQPGEGDPTTQSVLQSVWTDGLTYVSVFIEPYQPERHAKPMQTAIGATQTLMRRQGDWWITVMGEVPADTLKAFARTLQRTR